MEVRGENAEDNKSINLMTDGRIEMLKRNIYKEKDNSIQDEINYYAKLNEELQVDFTLAETTDERKNIRNEIKENRSKMRELFQQKKKNNPTLKVSERRG